MSKTVKTQKDYQKRAEQLLKKCAKDLKLNLESGSSAGEDSLDMRQFVVWLASQRPTLSRPSWRQYKSAAIYYLENLPDVEQSIDSLDYLREKTSNGCVLKSTKTSSQKLKQIKLEEWQKIDDYLALHTSKWSKTLRDWLKSGLLTGLRPIEWKSAKFFYYQGKLPALLIENAKFTNGRANGPTRTLLLGDLSTQELKTIKDHLLNVRTFTAIEDSGYEFFYNGCALTLYKVCRKIWPRRKRHVTLYSTRHQFSANAKSSGFTKSEVAAMMGHAVDITATIHYGKKINGNEPLMVKPVKEEVDTVRKIDTIDFKEMIRNKKDNLMS